MWRPERNTESLGRPAALLLIRKRVRLLRRSKRFLGMALLLLAFLAPHVLAGIAHAFALVGFRLAIGADLRGYLSDQLLVRAGHSQHRRLLGRDRDAGRNGVSDIMAEA